MAIIMGRTISGQVVRDHMHKHKHPICNMDTRNARCAQYAQCTRNYLAEYHPLHCSPFPLEDIFVECAFMYSSMFSLTGYYVKFNQHVEILQISIQHSLHLITLSQMSDVELPYSPLNILSFERRSHFESQFWQSLHSSPVVCPTSVQGKPLADGKCLIFHVWKSREQS